MRPDLNNITTDLVSWPAENDVSVSILRLDKIHPVISGNKWFKLHRYLEEAKRLGRKKIVTFGGAWSNHIVATAAACEMAGLSCAGIIRGEQPATPSPTLLEAKEYGMELYFITRDDYAKKRIPPELESSACY